MVQENRLLAVILLSEKTNGLPLNSLESYFVREVTASGTIALFNSLLYQNVSDLRDRLQTRKIILTARKRSGLCSAVSASTAFWRKTSRM